MISPVVLECFRGGHFPRKYLLDHFLPQLFPATPARHTERLPHQAVSENRSPMSRAPIAKSLIRSAFSTILSSPAFLEMAMSHS